MNLSFEHRMLGFVVLLFNTKQNYYHMKKKPQRKKKNNNKTDLCLIKYDRQFRIYLKFSLNKIHHI